MASQGRVGSLVLICVCQVLAMMLSVKGHDKGQVMLRHVKGQVL